MEHIDRLRKAGVEGREEKIKKIASVWIPILSLLVALTAVVSSAFLQNRSFNGNFQLTTAERRLPTAQTYYKLTFEWMRNKNNTLQGITRRLDIPYVFYDQITGKPYKDVKRSFNTALRKTGIVDFRFHDLRHTFASQLVMAGVDITTVSRLLGHKSLAMTLRYSHLSPGHLSKAVEAICYNFTTVTDSGRGLNAVTA